MKKLFAMLLGLALVSPAAAHFIWLAPTPNAGEALMVFSDSLEADANVPINKIAQTKMFARTTTAAAEGKLIELERFTIALHTHNDHGTNRKRPQE